MLVLSLCVGAVTVAELYAMAYGTPVIAHETGGLRDTVLDVPYHQSIGSTAGTGWTFQVREIPHCAQWGSRADSSMSLLGMLPCCYGAVLH